MADVNFSQWIENFARRVQVHRRRIGDAPAELNPPGNVLYDLQAAREELGAAEEELRLQNEHLQAALNEAEAERHRYRELFEFSLDGCIVTDLKGNIVEANHAAAQLLHMPAQYLPGKPFIRCLDGESQGAFRAELRQIQQTHGSSEITVRVQPRAAASFYGQLTLTAIVDKERHLLGIRCLLRDVTEIVTARQAAEALQEQVQQQLRHQAAQLEETCRTKDQSLERERKARLEAEVAVAARDRRLAVVAHELHTPLTPILASLGTAQIDSSLTPMIRRTLDLIRRNVEVQARLIDGLLETARIESGKMVLHRHPLDLDALLNDVLEVCRLEIAAKALELTLHREAAHHTVFGDAVRLQQVLWNIIKNAVKFSPKGGRLIIATGNPLPGRVCVQIADTGVGIEPAMLPRIFEAFQQEDSDSARQTDGLGLGLMIARSLVEAHGGTISAQSAGKGHGSTFTVDLPLAAESPEAAAAPAPHRTSRRGARILLVDDHRDTLAALTRALRAFGYGVQASTTCAGAACALQAESFDLLLTDMALPDGNGYDLLGLAGQRAVAAIALSGGAATADPIPGRSARFAAELTKPIDVAALDEAIQAALR